MLIDPMTKQMADFGKFKFKTFDFEFFQAIVSHPKLSLSSALQLVDLLTKVYQGQPVFASSVLPALISLLSRFLLEDSSNSPLNDLVLTFIAGLLRSLLDLEKNSEEVRAQ